MTIGMKVLGLGIAMIVFMAFLTDRSIAILIKFSRDGKAISYGHVMGEAFGNTGRVLLQVMYFLGQHLGIHHFGVLESWFGVQWWNGCFLVLLFSTLCVFAPWPLLYLRNSSGGHAIYGFISAAKIEFLP